MRLISICQPASFLLSLQALQLRLQDIRESCSETICPLNCSCLDAFDGLALQLCPRQSRLLGSGMGVSRLCAL